MATSTQRSERFQAAFMVDQRVSDVRSAATCRPMVCHHSQSNSTTPSPSPPARKLGLLKSCAELLWAASGAGVVWVGVVLDSVDYRIVSYRSAGLACGHAIQGRSLVQRSVTEQHHLNKTQLGLLYSSATTALTKVLNLNPCLLGLTRIL